ncbi:LSU ribosomal protein L10P [Bacillus thuringiensis str. Al Hakam]|nr:LSU ribosomal protein L10P [Bacillus thuringiensis str. Al Hakam]BAR73559.1 50S ribosomal protein L10 [Bacillus anthracis]
MSTSWAWRFLVHFRYIFYIIYRRCNNMSKVIETKQQVVTEIADKLRASKSTIVVDYRGLTVSEATELRKQLREAGVEFKVYKNSLTRRAAESAEMAELNEFLTGPNAIAFSNEDVVAPAKVLNDFAKDHEALEIKAGVIEGKLVTLDEVKAIATLPSREGLLSMLLSVLQAPIRNLALATKAVADQKEEQGA